MAAERVEDRTLLTSLDPRTFDYEIANLDTNETISANGVPPTVVATNVTVVPNTGSGGTGLNAVNGVVFSQLGTTDLTDFGVRSGSLGHEDYDSINDADINLSRIQYIGSVTTGGDFRFDFYDVSDTSLTTPVATVTATLSTTGIAFITVDIAPLISVPDNGIMEITAVGGAAGRWFGGTGAPTVGTESDLIGDLEFAADSRTFELTNVSNDPDDYGDAPAPYPTLAADNGAVHTIGALFLGGTVDGDSDGQPDYSAQGDDGNGNDEDGVVFNDYFDLGTTADVSITASTGGGLLNAWVDWNQDGDWIDPGEQIFTDQALSAGANALTISVPATAEVGRTYGRFRIDGSGGLTPTGAAADGEVEDHFMEIEDRAAGRRLNWVNRAQASDRFEDTFGGANVNLARNVVDAVLKSWERVHTDFNQPGGADQIDVTVSMLGSGTGFGASLNVTSFSGGYPTSGFVNVGRGNDTTGDGLGDGDGFFLDPTPMDISEFTGSVVGGAFVPYAGAGSPASGKSDLFTLVNAEITHSLGLFVAPALMNNPNAGTINATGILDDSEGGNKGTYRVFDGPSITHLMTSNNGGGFGSDFGQAIHSAGKPAGAPNQPLTFNSAFRGSVDLVGADGPGNAIYEFGRRYLVNDVMALIFKDAFTYDTTVPQTFGTTYSIFNEATGDVLIRGGDGASDDVISVTVNGGNLEVSVDIGNDVQGTGPNGDAGDIAAFVSLFPLADVASITIEAGNGNDTITIAPQVNAVINIDGGAPGFPNGGVGDELSFDITGVTGTAFTDNADGSGTLTSASHGTITWSDIEVVTDPTTGAATDFGDAPSAAQSGFASSYPVTLADDGARHGDAGATLGADVDFEADGVHSANADADDTTDTGSTDDEDGVTFTATTLLASPLSPSPGDVAIDLQDPHLTSNRLDAWVDWNQDGDWDDAGEKIFDNFDLGLTAGVQNLTFQIPQDTGTNVLEGTTYARFRLSSTGGLAPTGHAADGEVEDYAVQVGNTLPLVFTEIMFDPDSADADWEWIEVYNGGSTPIDVAGFVLDDSGGTARTGSNIAAGIIPADSYAVLYDSTNTDTDFELAWRQGINLIEVSSWPALNNGGDDIGLWASISDYGTRDFTTAVDELTYADNSDGWPNSGGNGASVYLTDVTSNNNNGSHWSVSADGTAGAYSTLALGGNTGGDVGSPGFGNATAVADFRRIAPLGSFISVSDNSGTIQAGETLEFSTYLDNGQTLAGNFDLDAAGDVSIEVVGVSGVINGNGGENFVVLPLQQIVLPGTYTIRVTSTATANFDLGLVLNAELEDPDSADGSEESLDASLLSRPGITAGRWAAVGISDATTGGGLTVTQSNNPGQFIDISGTGTLLNVGDESTQSFTSTIGNSFFPAGVLSVSDNGVLARSGERGADTNQNLPSGSFTNALVPFWDDFDGATVYWQEMQVGGIDTLIVQWDEIEHFEVFNSETVTFQVQVFATGAVAARYAYEDTFLAAGGRDGGAAATIGLQEDASTATVFSFNPGSATVVDGDVLDFAALVPDVDEYTVDLTGHAGETVDIALTGVPFDGDPAQDFEAQTLELLDTDGTTVIATATATPLTGGVNTTTADLAILDFPVPADGVYTLRLTSDLSNAGYSLVVAYDVTVDAEPNNDRLTDPLRNFTANEDAIGYLEAGTDDDDFFNIDLAPGDFVTFATFFVLGPQFSPVNTLDAELEVFDPTGTSVAMDMNSAPDGINAALGYAAAGGGTYTIRVGSTSGLGEYGLSAVITPASVLNSLVFNEVLPDPNSTTRNFDTDGDGSFEDSDEFLEIYNTSSDPVDVGGLEFWDEDQNNYFTVPASTILDGNGFLVIVDNIAGGSLPTVPAGSHAFSTDGSMSLGNTADNLVVYDPITDQFIQAVYNGDAVDTPASAPTGDYEGFSATATLIGSALDFGSDTDGTSRALSPDGNTSNIVDHDTIIAPGVLATPGSSNLGIAAALTVSIADASISENGGSTTATVSRNTDTTNSLVVTLMSNDTTEATVVGSVTIAAGQTTSPAFNIDGVDDLIVDGTQTVTITATEASHADGTDTVDVTDDDVAALTVSIADASISENGGSTTATVSRNTDTTNSLVVALMSDDTSEATVLGSVTIAAGQTTSPAFNIDAVDDMIVDGTQTVTITATEASHADGTDTVDVTDDDVAALTVSIADASISENGGSTTATVSRNTDTTNSLVVALMSDDTSEATVLGSVTIAAGQTTSPAFNIDAVDDLIVDGTQTVTITATEASHADGTDTVDVTDDDVAALTVSIADASISENGGSTTATVSRNTDTTNALTVTLMSSDTSEATVLGSVTIAAGQTTSPAFNIDAVDDMIVDGTQTVTITATEGSHADGTDTVDVTDDDVAALTVSIADASISEKRRFHYGNSFP